MGEERSIRVLFVDDEPLCARGLSSFFHRQPAWEFEIAADAGEGMCMFRSGAYDVVVMDWNMPGVSGLDLCRWLYDVAPTVGRILTTARADTEDVLRAFRSGADEYLVKPLDPRVLKARVEALARRSLRSSCSADGGTRAAGAALALTARQAQILECLSAGMANKEIADVFGFSVKNAEYHVGQILRKAGCSSRTGLVARMLQRRSGSDRKR